MYTVPSDNMFGALTLGGVLSKDIIALAKVGKTSVVSSDSFCKDLSSGCEQRPRSNSLTVSEEVFKTSGEFDVTVVVCGGSFSTAAVTESLSMCSSRGVCCLGSPACNSEWLLELALICWSRLCSKPKTWGAV